MRKPFRCMRCREIDQPRQGMQMHCIPCRAILDEAKMVRAAERSREERQRRKEAPITVLDSASVGIGNESAAILSAKWLSKSWVK